ncbi:unnamed protein product [Bemisia tabaci]|uniref:BTB domain-containing protein n=1 Tax=Bemisia tabaci TaxID=7038 RepID=A0A9P0AJ75_BEMTA|nr:unnamed protein product [Bemisia tabaci]
MIMDEQPHQELVKCVVVGDTAVGKTRLICARACNKQVSLSQLLNTHVPTVWAIDQYRIYKDVLERSWEVVDGVNVSLRLWDTFGDHEKDRRFAYGRSDVVLLCFSLTSHVSLRNCKAMWYPEIRRFCPQTPVLLVGCKNDLRFMYRDDSYLTYFRDKSPFVRPTRKCDLVMPDEARAVARELGIHYYETSVLTYFGVNEVFENAIRAALIARRQQRFWMTNLKKVQRPILQAPYCPPKPLLPEIFVQDSVFEDNLVELYKQQAYTDVVFVTGSVGFTAHRFILSAASPSLHRLLLLNDNAGNEVGRSASESSMVSSFGETTQGDFNEDTEHLIRTDKHSKLWKQLKRRSSCQVLSSSSSASADHCKKFNKDLSHPAFTSIKIQQCEGSDHGGHAVTSVQTIITLSKLVTSQAMQHCLQFLYTGSFDTRLPVSTLQEIRQAAEFMDLAELLVFVSNVQSHEEFLNTALKQRFKLTFRSRLNEICLGEGAFSDVLFQLDDGLFAAHRALLMARCDMMKAMFSGDFRESNAKVILFPGVKEETFEQLMTFLYTDKVSSDFLYCKKTAAVSQSRHHVLDILELANRLCLPRLVNLIEKKIVEELISLSGTNESEIVQHCIRLLEPCKLHNADQLADWLMSYLCVNYDKLCKLSPKLLRMLHPDNQLYITEQRWPPVWYLKDYDNYEKCKSEREKEDRLLFKRSSSPSGCLCFSSSSKASRTTPANHMSLTSSSDRPPPQIVVGFTLA